jgi:hypothetical protein
VTPLLFAPVDSSLFEIAFFHQALHICGCPGKLLLFSAKDLFAGRALSPLPILRTLIRF